MAVGVVVCMCICITVHMAIRLSGFTVVASHTRLPTFQAEDGQWRAVYLGFGQTGRRSIESKALHLEEVGLGSQCDDMLLYFPCRFYAQNLECTVFVHPFKYFCSVFKAMLTLKK